MCCLFRTDAGLRRTAGIDLPVVWPDRDVILAKRLGTPQTCLVWLHLVLGQPEAVRVVAGQLLHRGMKASPGHRGKSSAHLVVRRKRALPPSLLSTVCA
jgi:hypothetical protein